MSQGSNPPTWLLLVHQLPSRPTSLRVRIWRRLQDLGAVAMKNSVYVLPHSDQSREDFEWIKSEIERMGGEASVFLADGHNTFSNDEVVAAFRKARGSDYAELFAEAAALSARVRTNGRRPSRRSDPIKQLARLRARLAAIDAITVFPPTNREAVASKIQRLAQTIEGRHERSGQASQSLHARNFQHRVWVTRPRPGIDRLSSAWLIRRFIDPKARFSFSETAPSAAAAIPFDMFGVEFSHTDHGCTFETFVARFGLESPVLDQLGHIVHDLDLKDGRYNLPETPALGRLVDGLRAMHADDADLLEQGITIFEALYRAFSMSDRSSPSPKRRSKTKKKGQPLRRLS